MVQINAERTSERRTTTKQSCSSSSDPWMVFCVKLLLVALILLLLPRMVETKSPAKRGGARNKKKMDQQIVSLRARCQLNHEQCSKLVLEEAQNCIHECMSKVCYQETYAENPLEDGEIDLERGKNFAGCVKEELKQIRKEERAKEQAAKRRAASKAK